MALISLPDDVQDEGNNYTFRGYLGHARGLSRCHAHLAHAHAPHAPGALYRVLERLYALDINLVKLEGRPIGNRDFEFMFYFDLDCPVGSPALDTLLDALDDV